MLFFVLKIYVFAIIKGEKSGISLQWPVFYVIIKKITLKYINFRHIRGINVTGYGFKLTIWTKEIV